MFPSKNHIAMVLIFETKVKHKNTKSNILKYLKK